MDEAKLRHLVLGLYLEMDRHTRMVSEKHDTACMRAAALIRGCTHKSGTRPCESFKVESLSCTSLALVVVCDV